MGRRPDKPNVKKAKAGHFREPDKRQRRRKPAMSADERAQLLSSIPEGEVPTFLLDEGGFEMELRIWKDLSSDLRKINALARLDRFGFAMYCVHMADWIRATIDIRERGATYKARSTVTKDTLHKLNPMVKVREIAERHILELGARFGLDPSNRFRLIQQQAAAAGQGMLPFGDQPPPPPPDAGTAAPAPPAAQEQEDDGVTGILARKGAPPPTKH